MIVNLNSKEIEMSKGKTLLDLVNMQNLENDSMAIAVNDEVISKEKWNFKLLKPQDNILIITPTAGG
jgi:sulfur carrier protein